MIRKSISIGQSDLNDLFKLPHGSTLVRAAIQNDGYPGLVISFDVPETIEVEEIESHRAYIVVYEAMQARIMELNKARLEEKASEWPGGKENLCELISNEKWTEQNANDWS